MNWRHRLLMAGVSGFPLLNIGDGGEEGGGAGGGAEGAEGAAEGGAEGAEEGAEEGGEGAPAAEGAEGAAAGEEGGEEGGEEEAGAEGEPPARARVPWYQKRINQLTAQLKAVQEGGAPPAAEGAGAAPAEGAPPTAPAAGGGYVNEKGERLYTQAEIDGMVSSRAQLNELNRKADDLFDKGAKAFPKTWTTHINAAGNAFGQDLARRTDFFDALTELPNGDAVYHELTGDLDQMAEVLELKPTKLGMRLAEISANLAAPQGRQVSGAPAPITPVEENGGGEEEGPKGSMDSYAKDFERRQTARASRE